MALETYRKKRNFRSTPEPKGRAPRSRKSGLSFIIQKHAASHLHYDFRLELNGVLLSWAVPKGPSLDPKDKRLAMHVEDHPIEYGEFEGVIPPKQYGAGTVLLWDRGIWVPKQDPAVGYRKGKLKFDLDGEKLKGGWTLVRSHGGKYGGEKAWLLIKEADDFARRSPDVLIVEDKPKSVATGRTIDEIASDQDRVWHSNRTVRENVKRGAVKTKKRAVVKVKGGTPSVIPAFVEPQLATLVKAVPEGRWITEVKFDGYRMLCRIEGGEARLFSRNRKDWTKSFPDIATAAGSLDVDSAWLDGEVVALTEEGRSSFQRLQNALSMNDETSLVYYVFDIPYLNGSDLRSMPLKDRKAILDKVLQDVRQPLRPSFYREEDVNRFFQEACRLRLEGVIAKRPDSTYSGIRTTSWLKVKCGRRQEMVIGGYTDPGGSRQGFGALHLGVYENGQLRYAGKVGTGFDDASLPDLKEKLSSLGQKGAPFFNPPRGAEARRSHWVRPELVAEIAFTEWTDDGTLRHPSFQGLRLDKTATQVIREKDVQASPKSHNDREKDPSAVAGVSISNPDKVLYPESGITKKDLAEYYEHVGELMVPHLEHRPLTLLRCPNGWGKDCFYQKVADRGVPDVLERVKVSTSEGPSLYMAANSVEAIVSLLQMGALELHPWGSTTRDLGKPDRIVFDFDPSDELPWKTLVEAVTLTRTLLDEIGLTGFLRTTGGKGLHVVVPIRPTQPWDTIKGFSKAIADLFVATFPDRFTAKMTKATRGGKIFVDYLRNAEGSTAIGSYSLRARAKAPVATPLDWSELKHDARYDHFNVKTLPRRLKSVGDAWKGFFDVRQSVTSGMLTKVGFRPH